MSKAVTHRAPIILIYVTALFRMGVVVVGNHALFISKDLDDMTVWDDLLHVSCCSSNVAFWVHKYLTEGNVIMCISDVIYDYYYYDIINIQWVQQPFKRGMKPLERQEHSPSIPPTPHGMSRSEIGGALPPTPTYTIMARTRTAWLLILLLLPGISRQLFKFGVSCLCTGVLISP